MTIKEADIINELIEKLEEFVSIAALGADSENRTELDQVNDLLERANEMMIRRNEVIGFEV